MTPEMMKEIDRHIAEGKKEAPTPQQLVFKGLLGIGVKPVKALVFMAFYMQFPARFLPNNQFYFRPVVSAILKQLRVKEPIYQALVSDLVRDGWLQRRKAKSGGQEFRIVFEKVRPFIKGKEED